MMSSQLSTWWDLESPGDGPGENCLVWLIEKTCLPSVANLELDSDRIKRRGELSSGMQLLCFLTVDTHDWLPQSGSSSEDFLATVDCSLELWAKIWPLFKVASVRVAYHSNRKRDIDIYILHLVFESTNCSPQPLSKSKFRKPSK